VLLIRVINLRSFHWTVFFRPAWESYALAAALAVGASLAAAAYPAWLVFRTYPQIQLREE
jgi:putative ABC transport system permease protein